MDDQFGTTGKQFCDATSRHLPTRLTGDRLAFLGAQRAYLVIRNEGPATFLLDKQSTPGAYQLSANEVAWGTFYINKVFVTADADTFVDVAVGDPTGLIP